MQKGKARFWKKISPFAVSIAIGVIGFVLVYVILFNVVSPKRHVLTVGEIASDTITATKEIVDEVTTQKNIETARAQVESILKLDDTVTENVIAQAQEVLTLTSQYREKYLQLRSMYKTPEIDVYLPPVSLCDEYAQALPIAHTLSRDQISELLLVSDTKMGQFRTAILQVIEEQMSVGVRASELSAAQSQVLRDVQSIYYSVDAACLPLARAMVNTCMSENLFYDEEATEAAQLAAEEAVAPVIYKKGQNIVVQNEIVTQAQYEIVSKLGLLEDDSIDLNMYIGLAIIVLLVFLNVFAYLFLLERTLLDKPRMILLILTVYLLVMGMGVVVRQISIYLIPLQLGIFLMAILLKRRLAIVCNTSLAVLVGILATGDEGLLASGMFNILLVSVITGSLAVALSRSAAQRMSLVYAGLLVALMNFAAMMGIGLMTMSSIRETLAAALSFAGSGILSALLAIGFLPLLESVFGVVTQQKLMELADANHPLLRKLQTEAPGTYQHSLIVANLAEAAAQAIGANDLLTRVGAYYHDVGKLKRPYMFKENQLSGENPHDNMDPYVSAAVITAHTRDGVTMAQKYKLPACITDIIAQHHGQTMAAYFYYAACKQAEETGETVDTQEFTYEGPKPNSKEAAIISLADTMEAAVRSMKKHTREEIEQTVRKLIFTRLQDGQLENAPLTLAELEKITAAFVFALSGFYHDRIEYPDLKQVRGGADKQPAQVSAPAQSKEQS